MKFSCGSHITIFGGDGSKIKKFLQIVILVVRFFLEKVSNIFEKQLKHAILNAQIVKKIFISVLSFFLL